MNHEHLQLLVTRDMPCSKYKGRLIADLLGRYLNWFAREVFLPGEIGLLLALMLCKDRGNLVCENTRAWPLLCSLFMFNVRHCTLATSPPR